MAAKFEDISIPYLLTALAVLAILYSYARVWYVKRRLGVGSTPFREDGLFGFWMLKLMLEKSKTGELPEFVRQRFLERKWKTANMRLAGKMVVTTKDPENVKALLATQFNDFTLGFRHRAVFVTLGDGIFTLDGEGWKHLRAMLRPNFAREQVGHVELLEPRVQALFKHIRGFKGQKFDIQPFFFKLTIDSGTQFLFGESCESLGDSLDDSQVYSSLTGPEMLRHQFPEAFNRAQNMLFKRLSFQNFFWLGNSAQFRRDNAVVHGFTDYFVQKALNASEDELDKLAGGSYVFLYELVKQTRDPKVLRDQCLNILLAARDTTAGLLSFCFLELARNPHIYSKLRAEILDHFGDGLDLSSINFESLKKVEYLRFVLNETLRMYPSVPLNLRYPLRDTTLPRGGGPDKLSPIFVAAGTPVTYSIYSMHREEEYYGKDAMVFRPERWGEPLAKKAGWAFLPFNGGPRICLGQQFALTEASYVVVRILQNFESISSFDDTYPPALATHLTMSLLDGAHISLV